MAAKTVVVRDDLQDGYKYELREPFGTNFDPEFKPELTPKEMLELGVFGGHYLNDCQNELPKEWFEKAKLSDHGPDEKYNFFEVSASQPLKVWQEKGWIYDDDPPQHIRRHRAHHRAENHAYPVTGTRESAVATGYQRRYPPRA